MRRATRRLCARTLHGYRRGRIELECPVRRRRVNDSATVPFGCGRADDTLNARTQNHSVMSTSIASIAFSGMQAAQLSLQSSAHNLANLSTPGFHRQQAVQTAVPGGGVAVSIGRATQEGASFEGDLVAQLAAKNQFLANLAVFKTARQMTDSLLDAAG